MKALRKITGVVLIVLGVILGLYIGGWVMFIGGILNVIDLVAVYINTSVLDKTLLVFNILKIFFAGFVGYVTGLILVVLGLKIYLINWGENISLNKECDLNGH